MYLLTYLGPPVPVGTLGDEVRHLVRSLAITMAFSQLSATPIILRSSRSVSCHVFLGLPLRLFPPSGIHCSAVLAGLDGGSRSICPMNLLRLSATMSCRFIIPVLCSRSALLSVFPANPQYIPEASRIEDVQHAPCFLRCLPSLSSINGSWYYNQSIQA